METEIERWASQGLWLFLVYSAIVLLWIRSIKCGVHHRSPMQGGASTDWPIRKGRGWARRENRCFSQALIYF